MFVNHCARLEILKISGLPFVEQDQAIMDFFCKISGVSGLWADLSIDERRDLVSSGDPDNIWFQCFEKITSKSTIALFPEEWSKDCSFNNEDYTNFFCREAVGTEFVNTGTGSVMRIGNVARNRWKVLVYLFLLSADDQEDWKNPAPETYCNAWWDKSWEWTSDVEPRLILEPNHWSPCAIEKGLELIKKIDCQDDFFKMRESEIFRAAAKIQAFRRGDVVRNSYKERMERLATSRMRNSESVFLSAAAFETRFVEYDSGGATAKRQKRLPSPS